MPVMSEILMLSVVQEAMSVVVGPILKVVIVRGCVILVGSTGVL